jgi:glycine hydroxymethyltransferase
MALIPPGEKIMGMSLPHGGHLSHGAAVNHSGVIWKAVHYGVDPATGRIDYDVVREQARRERPRLIIAGGSAYARIIDFAAFRSIADEVGAIFLVDMAHFAGLVAGGVYPSPVPHSPIVTSTTHKTLRGPRAGLILCTAEHQKAVDKSVFPGTQGGPLEHVIAAKAVAFGEALRPDFKVYAKNVIENAKAMGEVLVNSGFALVSGGTDTHLILLDLRPKKLTGNISEKAMERAHITCNKNGVPFDPEKPMVTSGVRLGAPAGTTRGFGVAEFQEIGRMIAEVLDGLAKNGVEGNGAVEEKVKAQAIELCKRFPIYS